MSDLADLAEQLTKDLPIAARRVIDKALECGWELNKPGMTVALRLNHPTDELAQPVYITWVVSRTAKGQVSFRFDSCGTKGLHKLKPADLLEYLEDPTTVYDTDEDLETRHDEWLARQRPKWDENAPAPINVAARLDGTIAGITSDKKASEPKRKTFAELQAEQKAKLNAATLKVTAPALRVAVPKIEEDKPPWD